MQIKTKQQVEYIRTGGHILYDIMLKLKSATKPGVSAKEIEDLSEKLLKENKCLPAFKGFDGYPYNTCISVNDEIVHGLPTKDKIFKENDIVSIDFGVKYKGFCTDSATTFALGKTNNQIDNLLKNTKKSLYEGIKLIKPGVKLGTIQAKIQEVLEKANLKIIYNLTGHGIGQYLQESPEIPNYGYKNQGITLKEGMTFCLEPMASISSSDIIISDDDWTIKTADSSYSAHFEHTIVVTESGYEILTKY